MSFVETLGPDDFAALFLSDLSLVPYTSYTNDKATLREAAEKIAMRATSNFDWVAFGKSGPSVPVVASAESGGRADRDAGASEVMQLTHNTWEGLARDQQGYATTNALSAVAAGLSVLPGRKTMVVFAEGLSIPDAVLPRFREVVAAANRANVTIYSVDAQGLRVHSSDAAIGREVRAMGNAGLAISADGSNMSSLAILERNEDVLRKDPRTSLRLLAEPTGGFVIDNTNDLARGLAIIDQDRRFHYLLTYTPKNQTHDGTWRALTVRVPSRQVQIRAAAATWPCAA